MGRSGETVRAGRSVQRIRPMLARLSDLPADEHSYGFEYKWDGVRCLAYCSATGVLLESRNGLDMTARYPELAAPSSLLRKGRAVLDGEIVALDSTSLPSFSLLQRRMHASTAASIARGAAAVPAVYMVFDVLSLDGVSLLDLRYEERRAILTKLRVEDGAWRTPPFFPGDGKRLLAVAMRMGLEGIVAKRLDSRYLPGERSNAWLKIKVRHRQEFVVGGYLPGTGKNSRRIGSLLLGYYESPGTRSAKPVLRYAGNVGTGFSEQERATLRGKLDALRRSSSPFADTVRAGGLGGPAVFSEPKIVAEISYAEMTPGGMLRHPVYHGLRTDKRAGTVVLEVQARDRTDRSCA